MIILDERTGRIKKLTELHRISGERVQLTLEDLQYCFDEACENFAGEFEHGKFKDVPLGIEFVRGFNNACDFYYGHSLKDMIDCIIENHNGLVDFLTWLDEELRHSTDFEKFLNSELDALFEIPAKVLEDLRDDLENCYYALDDDRNEEEDDEDWEEDESDEDDE